MLGTIAELDAFYFMGRDADPSSRSIVNRLAGASGLGGWTIPGLLSAYGASEESIKELAPELLQTALGDIESGAKSLLDASELPPIHPSWGAQRFNVADGGVLFLGTIVYAALRFGLIAKANPFPDQIALVVVAATTSSIRNGRWTSSDATPAAEKATVDGSERVLAWNDENLVYVILPVLPRARRYRRGRVHGIRDRSCS